MAEKHIPTCGFYIINNDRSSCYELYNSTSDAFRFWTNSCVCGYNLDVELLNPTSFSSSLWFSPSFLPFTRFSCWTSSPPFSFRSPSSIYDLYPSSKFLNPDSSSFSISIFISSGVPLWSVLPRPRVFYFSLRSPPLHPSIFPSLPLFPHPLTISSPDRPQTSLVSFKEISPGKKNTWRSQLPFPYKTPVKAITYNSWISFSGIPSCQHDVSFPDREHDEVDRFFQNRVREEAFCGHCVGGRWAHLVSWGQCVT